MGLGKKKWAVKRQSVNIRRSSLNISADQIFFFFFFVTATLMGVEINNDKAYNLSIDRGIERFQKFWLQFDFIYNFTNLQKEKESCLNIVRALPEFVRILFPFDERKL